MNTKIIKLDINRRLYDKIVAKQDDTGSRFLLFQLLDGAVPFNLTDRSVRVYGVKPDGAVIFNDLTVTHSATGFCLLELTNQMLAIAGTVKLELMITEGDKKLTSIPFEMEVIKKINSNAAVESSNEFGALLTALKEIDQWNREFADKSGKLEELYTPRLNELSSQLDTIKNEMVYAVDFGVKADGITDDTVALQNAIDYLKPKDISNLWGYQNCGGTLILPKGLIKISKTIRLYSNVKIIGTNKSLFGRVTDDTTILLDTIDKTIPVFSFVGIETNTNEHSNKLFITGEEIDNGTVTQTWNVTLEGFTLKSKNGNDLAINLSGGVKSKINDVSFNNFDIDIFASANWDNEINNCNTLCNFAHMVLVGGNTLLVNSPYINPSENIKSSLNDTHIMYPYVNNENLVYKNTPSGIINIGLYGLNVEKPIIEKIKIGVQICMSELGAEKYYNNCSINKIHMEHIEKAFVFKNIACLINGVFAYITPETSEYLIEGYSSHITGINVQPIKHIKLYKEDINGCYNFFGSVNEWITRTELSGATIGKTIFEYYNNESIRKTWQTQVKELIGDVNVENQYADLKEVNTCVINTSKLVISSPPDSPIDVRYSNTVILNSSSAKTVYSFNARDFQEFTLIAIAGNISLNGNESGGLMVIKGGVIDPIPVGGVMKFICYNGVCYEISRSF